jgi:hypothetical protein
MICGRLGEVLTAVLIDCDPMPSVIIHRTVLERYVVPRVNRNPREKRRKAVVELLAKSAVKATNNATRNRRDPVVVDV